MRGSTMSCLFSHRKSLPGEDTEKRKISKLLKSELQTVTRRAVNGKPLEKVRTWKQKMWGVGILSFYNSLHKNWTTYLFSDRCLALWLIFGFEF